MQQKKKALRAVENHEAYFFGEGGPDVNVVVVFIFGEYIVLRRLGCCIWAKKKSKAIA